MASIFDTIDNPYTETVITPHSGEYSIDYDADRIAIEERNQRRAVEIERQRQEGLDAQRAQNTEDHGDFARGLYAGVDQMQSMAGGVTALAGSALGEESGLGKMLTDYGMEVFQRNEEEASLYEKTNFTDNPLDWAQYTMGNLMPSMAEAVAGATVGSLVAPGAGTIAGGIAGKTLLKKSIYELTKKTLRSGVLKKQAANILRATGNEVTKASIRKAERSLAINAAKNTLIKRNAAKAGSVLATWQMEAGGNYGEAKEAYGSDASAMAATVTGLGSALLELAGGNMRIIDKVFGGAGVKTAKEALAKGDASVIRRMFKEAFTQMPSEGAQEGAQELLSLVNMKLNDEEYQIFTEENIARMGESAGAGMLAGGVLGGGTGLLSKPSINIDTRKQRIDNEREAIKGQGGDALDQAVASGGQSEATDEELIQADIEAAFDTIPSRPQEVAVPENAQPIVGEVVVPTPAPTPENVATPVPAQVVAQAERQTPAEPPTVTNPVAETVPKPKEDLGLHEPFNHDGIDYEIYEVNDDGIHAEDTESGTVQSWDNAEAFEKETGHVLKQELKPAVVTKIEEAPTIADTGKPVEENTVAPQAVEEGVAEAPDNTTPDEAVTIAPSPKIDMEAGANAGAQDSPDSGQSDLQYYRNMLIDINTRLASQGQVTDARLESRKVSTEQKIKTLEKEEEAFNAKAKEVESRLTGEGIPVSETKPAAETEQSYEQRFNSRMQRIEESTDFQELNDIQAEEAADDNRIGRNKIKIMRAVKLRQKELADTQTTKATATGDSSVKTPKATPANWESSITKARVHVKSLIDNGSISKEEAGELKDNWSTLSREELVAAGKKQKPTSDYGKDNKLVSSERADEIRAKLKAKLNQLNAGFDPEMFALGTELAAYHIEAGARSFAKFTKTMVDDLGDKAKPFLRSWYLGGRNYPGMDKAGMNTEAELDNMDIDDILNTKEVSNGQTIDSEIHASGSTGGTQETSQGGGTGGISNDSGKAVSGDKPTNAKGSDGESASGVQGESATKRDGANDSKRDIDSADDGVSKKSQLKVQPVGDYQITDDDKLGHGGAKTKAKNNVAAIKLVQKIITEERPATAGEQKILAKYVGWGASDIANNIFPSRRYDHQQGRQVDVYKNGWETLGKELKSLLSDADYSAAKQSTLNAHYTSKPIIDEIYKALEKLGFDGGRILEPGSGIGNFIGLLPDSLAGSRFTAVEMDGTSSQIAKLLYPNQDVRHQDYAKFKAPNGFYDVALGNPPFANITITGDPDYAKQKYNLHDFFFAKSIDKVRPGGLMVLITSKGTMDKASDRARMMLSSKADLIGAIRLPQTAFKENAGTEVVTDVIFMRKKVEGEQSNGESWSSLASVKTTEKGVTTQVNEYYKNNPQMVLGRHSLEGSMYRSNMYTVVPKRGDIQKQFAKAVESLPSDVYGKQETNTATTEEVVNASFAPDQVKEGGLFIEDGKIFSKEEGAAVPFKGAKSTLPLVTRYIALRDSVKALLHSQLTGESDAKVAKAQEKMRVQYKMFVAKHGFLNKETVSSNDIVRTPNFYPIKSDPDVYLVFSIEKYDRETNTAEEADIFTQRVINPPVEPEIESVIDALHVSLYETGNVDIPLIAAKMGITEANAISGMGDAVFEDPTLRKWVTDDEYLSGNVKQKLRDAQSAAEIDSAYKRNIAALEAVQPEDLPLAQMRMSLGMPIIDTATVSEFAKEILELGVVVNHLETSGAWDIRVLSGNHSPMATTVYGTTRRNAVELLNAALNNKVVQVYDRDASGKATLNKQATEAANAKLQKIQQKFSEWAWESPERAATLSAKYNAAYNNSVTRNYGGEHVKKMTFPGLSPAITPYDHQSRAAWRIVQQGNTYMAHSVGSGKTISSIVAGQELKRLGIKKKPMWVVPNHMLRQFSQEFLQLYPAAKILVADEEQFSAKNRKRFAGRVAAENWDGIIITHSAFGKMQLSAERQQQYIQDQIAELEDMAAMSPDRITVKQIQAQMTKLTQRLEKLMDAKDKDNVVTFEETGIDQLFIDESQDFRKIDFITSQSNVKGIDPKGSMKGSDLYSKVQYLESLYPNRSLVLMSGTPITNTMGELFSIQRLLQGASLKALGIHNFDAWASSFGTMVSNIEATPAGTYKNVSRFAKFKNLAGLYSMWSEIGDYVRAKDLAYIKRPTAKNGGRKLVIVEQSDLQQGYKEQLAVRLATIAKNTGKPQKGDDIILSVITDGRHAALDDRFIDPSATPSKTSKIAVMTDSVVEIWNKTKKDKSTQMIFSDLGRDLGGNRGFSAYNQIVEDLVAKGIPREEIAVMQDYKKSKDKQALFDDMNAGKIRVLIGSSQAMGTGVNAQKKLYALHHLDPDNYLPANIEQREGRIVRQGNSNSDVEMFAYVTKGSFDETMWQFLETKQGFIDQFFSGNAALAETGDVDGMADQYGVARAMSSDNPLVIEKAGVESELSKLESMFMSHQEGQRQLVVTKREHEQSISRYKSMLESYEKASKEVVSTKGDTLKAIIGGVEYTDRKEMAAALTKKLNSSKAADNVPLGNIGGFRLVANIGSFAGVKSANVRIKDHGVDIDVFTVMEGLEADTGKVMQIENSLRKIAATPADLQESIDHRVDQIEKVDAQAGAKFEHQEALDAKRERLTEINETLTFEEETEESTEDKVLRSVAVELEPTGNTVAQVEKEIKGDFSKLVASGKIQIVQSLEGTPLALSSKDAVLSEEEDADVPNSRRDIVAREVRAGRVISVATGHRITSKQADAIREAGGGGMLVWLGGEHTGSTGHILVPTSRPYGGRSDTLSQLTETALASSTYTTQLGVVNGYSHYVDLGDTSYLYSKNGSIAGYYKDGQITLIADNIQEGEAPDVLNHEGLHLLLRADKTFVAVKDAMLADVDRLHKQGSTIIKDIFENKVPEDTPAKHKTEEALAYLVQHHKEHRITKRIMSAIKAWLYRHGIKLGKMSESDLVALVKQGIRSFKVEKAVATKDADTLKSVRTATDAALKKADDFLKKAEQERSGDPKIYTDNFGDSSVIGSFRKAIDGFANLRKGFRTTILDRYNPILEQLGEEAYKAHRMLNNAGNILGTWLQHGGISWEGNVPTFTGKKDSGFLPWFESLGDDGKKLLTWIAVKRAEKLDAEGRENWLTEDKRKELLEWVGDSKDWKALNKQFQKFNKEILDLAQEAGVISGESRATWEDDFYIPFYRDDGSLDVDSLHPQKSKRFISSQIKRLKGGEMKIGDLLENTLRNWGHLISESQRNIARNKATEVALELGIAERINASEAIRESKSLRKEGQIISSLVEGTPEYIRVTDPALFQAMSEVDLAMFDSTFMKAMGMSKRMLTLGATSGAAFRVANAFRDTVHTAIVAQSFAPFIDTWKGAIQVMRESDDYIKLMISSGGFGHGYLDANDPHAMSRQIKGIARNKGKSKGAITINTPKQMWELWQHIGHISEMAARTQLYTNLKAEGKSHEESAFQSRDLLDFGLGGNGTVLRAAVSMIPFLNARMQGLDKMYRATKENPKQVAFRGALMVAASLALWSLFKDDERYKELEDWEKWQYHHFWVGDQHYRLPKAFEAGALFSTIPESLMNVANGTEDGKYFAEMLKHTLSQTFSVGAPAMISPALEVMTNKSAFTGRDIENMGDKMKPAGMRSSPWTSETLKAVGEQFNISPKKLETLVRGHFATLGMGVLMLTDMAMEIGTDAERPSWTINQYPLAGRFVRDTESKRTKYATRMYEVFGEIDMLAATIRTYQRTGDMDMARKTAKEGSRLLRFKKLSHKTRRRLSGIRREEFAVWNNKTMTGDEKREALNRLGKKKNMLYYNTYKILTRKQR